MSKNKSVSDLKLMSRSRHQALVKAAELCVELMENGADAIEAMKKAARDYNLNQNEIRLVSHAINNSRQVANLQDGESRLNEFSLIDPDAVYRQLDEEDRQPVSVSKIKKAALIHASSQNVFAGQNDHSVDDSEQNDSADLINVENMGFFDRTNDDDTNEADDEEPTSLIAGEKIRRARNDLIKSSEYHAILSKVFAIPAQTVIVETYVEPVDPEHVYRHAIDSAREKYAEARDIMYEAIDRIHAAFDHAEIDPHRLIYLCKEAGISDFVLKVIAAPVMGRLTEAGFVKVASQVYAHLASEDEFAFVQLAKLAEDMYEAASSWEAVHRHLKNELAAAEQSFMIGNLSASSIFASDVFQKKTAEAAIDDKSASFSSWFNTIPGNKYDFVAEKKYKPTEEYKYDEEMVNHYLQLQEVFADEVIRKYPPREIMNSYRRSQSLGYKLSLPEVIAFIRQDLSSRNAIPLDLYIKLDRRASMPNQSIHGDDNNS